MFNTTRGAKKSRVCSFLSNQNKIEGIKTKQAETAENLIRLQFRMEQLVYCQDEIYREVLNQVRKEFFNPVGTSLKDPELKLSFSKDQSSMSSITEIGTHLNAYFWVST